MEVRNATEIICILDKSGSMGVLQEETIQGLNRFIREQQQEQGKCNFTLVQFNQYVRVTIKQAPIEEVKELNTQSYQPDGYTALLDAVGTTLKTAIEAQFFSPATALPSQVLVFIITDGMENASKLYSRKQVYDMIQNLQTAKGWEFRFFGANIDAFGEAENIGICKDNAMQWERSKAGVEILMEEMNMMAKKVGKK